MDFDNLDLGIQSTQAFSPEDKAALEGFLNSSSDDLENIEEKPKPAAPVKKEAIKEDTKMGPELEKKAEEEAGEEEEESIDILEELTKNTKSKNEKEEDDESENGEEEDETATNHFEVISQELLSLGVFSEDENNPLPTTAEEFAARFQKEKQQGAVQWLESFLSDKGEDRRELFDAIFVNGVDPREYLPVYNQVLDYEALDLSIEANQERVYRDYYKSLNWDPNKIETRLQKVKDYGDLQDEAEEIHSKLIEQSKEKTAQIEAQKKAENAQRKLAEQQYQQTVTTVLQEALKSKELSGFPITDAKAREVQQFLLKPQYKLPNGELLTEFDKFILESKKPENIKDRVLIAMMKSSNFDFSKIEKKAVSKETNQLFSKLKKTAVKSKNTEVAQDNNYWGNL